MELLDLVSDIVTSFNCFKWGSDLTVAVENHFDRNFWQTAEKLFYKGSENYNTLSNYDCSDDQKFKMFTLFTYTKGLKFFFIMVLEF